MTKVCGEILIEAKQDAAWNVLADLGGMSKWNPSVSDSYYTSDAK